MTRRRVTAAGIAVAIIAVGATVTTRLTTGPASQHGVGSNAVTTATVQLTDLAETTPVSGTVGFARPYTIVQPAGTGPQDVSQAQQSVALARLDLSQAQATLASDTAQLQADQATLTAAQQKQANDCEGDAAAASPSTLCSDDTADVASTQEAVDADQQKVTTDEDNVAAAQLALTNAQAALATARAAATAYYSTSKYTVLPGVGQVVQPGQSLWSVDGRPVALLPGSVIPWRAFVRGMSRGADVAALNYALVRLGFGPRLKASDVFSGATTAAIRRLQASLGVPRTGTLALGSVVFGPTAVRVTTVHPLVGTTVGGGQPVLDVTSTTPVVNVALPVGQTSRVKVGNPVSVNLPDGTTVDGTITAVGTVATDTTPPGRGNDNTSATLNVVVTLTKASPAGSLDQAPVTVNITNNAAHQVLAVPTTALLALAGGGYAVEVAAPGGTHELVGVTTGIFDDQSGLVQVDGPGLAAGQRVVVAS